MCLMKQPIPIRPTVKAHLPSRGEVDLLIKLIQRRVRLPPRVKRKLRADLYMAWDQRLKERQRVALIALTHAIEEEYGED